MGSRLGDCFPYEFGNLRCCNDTPCQVNLTRSNPMSFSIQCLFEGVDALEIATEVAREHISRDLGTSVLEAADEAIREMRTAHSYTDRTYRLTDTMTRKLRSTRNTATATITFGAPYAKFVNDGTKKSKPYPFVPGGLVVAEKVLEHSIEGVIERACRGMAGGP